MSFLLDFLLQLLLFFASTTAMPIKIVSPQVPVTSERDFEYFMDSLKYTVQNLLVRANGKLYRKNAYLAVSMSSIRAHLQYISDRRSDSETDGVQKILSKNALTTLSNIQKQCLESVRVFENTIRPIARNWVNVPQDISNQIYAVRNEAYNTALDVHLLWITAGLASGSR